MNHAADIDPPLRLLVICAALLFLKFLATTMVQGRRGFEAGTRLPEDAALPMAKGMPPPAHGHTFDALTARAHDEARRRALESDLRWKRIVQNDLESVPLALIVFTVAILVGANAPINSVALVVYTAARAVHTVVFAAKLAWLRMITWMVGILCILVACGNGVYTAITLK